MTMANTYTQIYLHVVFAVKNRESLIMPEYESELYAYICGICKNRKHHVIAINGTANHIHILISMHPSESISLLVQNIKIHTSKWFHDIKLKLSFEWQAGFGAFSYSKSLLPAVTEYISNQKTHHNSVSFEDEMKEIYRIAGIDYDERFILKDVM